jgi:penicillin-binding protein 1C
LNKLKTKVYRKLAGALLQVFELWYNFSLPRPHFDTPYSLILQDRQGELLSARIAEDGQWRFPPPDSLPEKYVHALILFEDQRFFRHPGIDLRAVARAIGQNLRSRRIVSGASTITMQTIRLARGDRQRNLWNKMVEVILATRLELSRSKADILRIYAAQAPFGGNVVGLDAAAWRYFGKSPQYLSWAEAATLAVLPNSPGLIHPGRNRAALRAKRNRLLKKLADQGLIDDMGLELAMAEELPQAPLPLPRNAPHLLEKAARDYQTGKLPSPRVLSSIDLSLQRQMSVRVEQHREVLAANQIHNAAAVLIHIPSNQILAYVGNAPGAGASHGGMVDILEAPRSTGSILKPFLYAMALEDGLILPGSLLRDVPSNFNGYRPENYHRGFHGAIPADEALARSLNIPFVHLLKEYGLELFHLQLLYWA